MRAATRVLLALNKLFKAPVHPFNLQGEGVMTYAEWQYEKGGDTVKFFTSRYPEDELFASRRVLDIGCGAGGKSLYFLRCGAASVIGVDIVESYREEAEALAAKLGYSDRFTFLAASADALPMADGSVDLVIMNDAMEHVADPVAVLGEVRRVLARGGRLCVNFPPYYHPFGAHLSDAIYIPWVHMFFSERTLIEAYREALRGNPDAESRLAFRFSTGADGREHITYINKMTIKRFRGILRGLNIEPEYYAEVPLRPFLKPLSRFPLTREIFTKMVVAVIENN